MLGIPGAAYKECGSQVEAFGELGRATMAGQKRVLGTDGSEDVASQPTSRVRKPGRVPQSVNRNNDTKVETRRDNSHETFIQCPPASSSRVRSTIQRADTLPPQQPQSSSNDLVQRSRTVPNLKPSPVQPTPERSVRRSASNIGRSGVTPALADGPTIGGEGTLPSPAANVSTTPGPTFEPHFPLSPPRETPPSRSLPTGKGNRGDGDQTSPQCCGSGTHEKRHKHQIPAARSVRGGQSSTHAISAPPPETVANHSVPPVRSTTWCGTTRHHQPSEVVRGSPPSTNLPPSRRRGTNSSTPHTPLGHGGNHRPPSSVGSSELTYVSDDERPAGCLAQSTSDPGYYTPFSRISEMSDADPEPPGGASSSSLKWKGKRRASPPPPSPTPSQGSSAQVPRPSSPSLPTGSSSQNPNFPSDPSREECKDRDPCPPNSQNDVNSQQTRDQTPAHDPSQVFGQDVCHCTGPCPSCHKSRFHPHPPQFHPSMLHLYAAYYPHLFLPPPHPQTGYQPSHYGPPPYPYPYPVPQTTGPPPSISSAQPIPPTPGYPVPTALTNHPITHSLSAPVRASSSPTSSAPPLGPSISAPVPPRPLVNPSPSTGPPATDRAPSGPLEALDQFYQPLQRPVDVVDPSFDPRSPYSRRSTVPAFPNR